jgi:hypothetical protein
MKETKRKWFYWLFKILSLLVSCALPIWAILERYPVWVTTHGKNHSVGAGAILIAIVLLIIFRRPVFKFLRERCNLMHAPPIVFWIVMLILSYVLAYIGKIIYDLVPVFWMGLLGCGIGTVLTFIAENRFGKEKDNERA